MRQRQVAFYSDGYRLDGTLYLPDDLPPGQRRPVIIGCSGYTGLNSIHPARFARYFTRLGYVCFGFDYRGWAASEGPRGRVMPLEQAADIQNAITFVQQQPEVLPEQVALIGWGLGGALVLHVAAEDERVKAVACLNGFGDGERTLRAIKTHAEWLQFKRLLAEDRVQRVLTGQSRAGDPFIIFPLDPVTTGYVDGVLRKNEQYGEPVTLESGEGIIAFKPVERVDRIAPRGLFIGHGTENGLHPVDEALDIYARAGEPKRLHLLHGHGHTEWMADDHPVFLELMGALAEWFPQFIGAPRPA